MKCHYQISKGWMSAPCGISRFKGKYHLFYQYNPDAPRWGYMHWGHCVTEDFISYDEVQTAMSPAPGESLFGGSSIVKNDMLYLFYVSGNEMRTAVSEDGINFEDTGFETLKSDCDYFMDPHVFEYEDYYLMVVGTGRHNVAGIELYRSDDLAKWEKVSELVSDLRFGSHIESPNLFRVEEKWCLMFASSRQLPSRIICALGAFDGSQFTLENDWFAIESGPDLYNTYVLSEQERNIALGWYYDRKTTSGNAKGLLTCAREVSLNPSGDLRVIPAKELYDNYLVRKESDFVSYDNGRLRVVFEKRTVFDKAYASLPSIETVEDVGTLEVFLKGGTDNITILF